MHAHPSQPQLVAEDTSPLPVIPSKPSKNGFLFVGVALPELEGDLLPLAA
jgi:hypothetical protein